MRHVTLPLMSPVIFYSLTLGLVEVLQYFLVPFVLKNGTGEPGGTTYFFNLYIYKSFFTFQHMSYGATLAWLLFVITLVLTLLALRVRAALGLLRRGSQLVTRRTDGRPPGLPELGRGFATAIKRSRPLRATARGNGAGRSC